jgi:quinol monooxygenase YgiN
MIVIRNTFHCKPGKAKELVTKLKASGKAMKSAKLIAGFRVMTDTAATFWTVVLETEHASLEAWESAFPQYGSHAKIQAAMEGYMELVESGRREIWKLE